MLCRLATQIRRSRYHASVVLMCMAVFGGGIARTVTAQAGRVDRAAGVAGWIAAHSVVVEREADAVSTYTTDVRRAGPCRLVLRITDSSFVRPVQIVSEKVVSLEYTQLESVSTVLPLGTLWLVRLSTIQGQELPIHTRFVIQGQTWTRDARVSFVELVAPQHTSADTLSALLHDAVVGCNGAIQFTFRVQRAVP